MSTDMSQDVVLTDRSRMRVRLHQEKHLVLENFSDHHVVIQAKPQRLLVKRFGVLRWITQSSHLLHETQPHRPVLKIEAKPARFPVEEFVVDGLLDKRIQLGSGGSCAPSLLELNPH